MSDNANVQPTALTDSSGQNLYVSPAEDSAWKQMAAQALNGLFSPSLASQFGAGAGQSGASSAGQVEYEVGSAGAAVLSYQTVDVTGAQAVVQAVVERWEKIAWDNVLGPGIVWQNRQDTELVEDTLSQDSTGHWVVTDREFTPYNPNSTSSSGSAASPSTTSSSSTTQPALPTPAQSSGNSGSASS